jgi:putative flippase GtrA
MKKTQDLEPILESILSLYIQGVSKIHSITSGVSSSYVDNKNILYQHRSGNA